MRTKLRKRKGERKRFRGVFERYGTKPNYHGFPEKTVLLKDVTEVGSRAVVTDHLWFSHTKGFQALGGLQPGDVVEFDARVKEYRAGYRGRKLDAMIENPPRTDFKLSHPTKIERVDGCRGIGQDDRTHQG